MKKDKEDTAQTLVATLGSIHMYGYIAFVHVLNVSISKWRDDSQMGFITHNENPMQTHNCLQETMSMLKPFRPPVK